MSAIRYHVPDHRLGKLLSTPGGLPVADAVAEAETRLAELAAPAREELAALLAASEAAVDRLPGGFDGGALSELYSLAHSGIGLGRLCARPSVDLALQSLCDLLDHLSTHERWDREAVAVHVQAMRLLIVEEGDGAEAVLLGLQQVSRRYAGPESPAG